MVPFDADGEFGTWVVTVSVLSGIVVPGMMVAGLVVPGATVVPLIKLGAEVKPVTVDGRMVVPGIVVVYVISLPRPVRGMALPTPAAVYWVGSVRVAVSGFDVPDGEPYKLP